MMMVDACSRDRDRRREAAGKEARAVVRVLLQGSNSEKQTFAVVTPTSAAAMLPVTVPASC